jgi:hypothetical protein
MRILMFSVFDVQLGEFNSPMAFPSKGVAIRSFLDEAKRDSPDNQVFKHPADFSFHFVGEFDSGTGQYFMPDSGLPELMIEASAV